MRFYPFVFTSTDEGGIAAYYNYTADGERNIKFTSPRLNIQQNASLFNNPPLVYPTLYASPLITLNRLMADASFTSAPKMPQSSR